MPGRTLDELTIIAQADELDLASERRDNSLRHPVTMWIVRDGGGLYLRSTSLGPVQTHELHWGGRWWSGSNSRCWRRFGPERRQPGPGRRSGR
ncbi:DUF2255 family protein [Micromonospora sp. CPCC 206060]|uniref:DUF2255 family protein n=1 Tax=Micromonospora sp. CPCC 206060 TaxID=3122406 RepID=UPI002FF43D34